MHLELGTDLSRDAWSMLTLPTIRNFLASEMGASVVPPREGSPGLLHNDLNTVLPTEVFDTYCHIFETYAGPTQSDHAEAGAEQDERKEDPQTESNESVVSTPSGTEASLEETDEETVGNGPEQAANLEAVNELSGVNDDLDSPVEGGQLNYEPYMDYVEEVRKQSDGPLLHVISMDTAQPAFESRLGDFANYVALHNDLTILITKPGTELRKRADRVADMHFRLERSGEAIVLYGENPLTPLLGIGINQSPTIPTITLTEMV